MTQQTIDTTASPVVPPATGLAAFELNVSATPLVISFDVDALNSAVDAVLENYAGLEIEEGDIAAIKSEMAGLNKIKERIESARKDIAGRISAPVKEFEAQVKAAAQRIADVRAKLDEKVKDLEKKQRQARSAGVQTIIDDVLKSADLADFTVTIDERWLNKSASKKDIRAAVESVVLREKAARLQAEQWERAKQDRMTWLEKAVKTAGESYAFELPMSRFLAFLNLDTTMEEAQEAINAAFGDEQARRHRATLPQRTTGCFGPAPAPMPTCDDDAMPTVEDDPPMPTAPAASTEGRREMTIHLTYAPAHFREVMDLLRKLNSMGIVTVNGTPLPQN